MREWSEKKQKNCSYCQTKNWKKKKNESEQPTLNLYFSWLLLKPCRSSAILLFLKSLINKLSFFFESMYICILYGDWTLEFHNNKWLSLSFFLEKYFEVEKIKSNRFRLEIKISLLFFNIKIQFQLTTIKNFVPWKK